MEESELEKAINYDTLNQLISIHKDDPMMTEVITDALESFEKYHQAIYRLEIRRKLYACGAMDAETYRSVIPEMDDMRTKCHNNVLAQVNLLNRLAQGDGLAPFYDGEISEEKPIRTWVADAILEFVRQTIDDRVTAGR